jgi:hypothetical protein
MEKLDFTFGLPPDDLHPHTNIVMRNSMPLAKIYPGIPSFQQGTDLFTRGGLFEASGHSLPKKDQWQKGTNKTSMAYHDLLRDHKFELSQTDAEKGQNGCIAVAFLADSFPTDSFTNEYGENFLQKFTDVASEGAASLAQMFGVRDAGEAFRKMTGAMKKKGGLLETAAGGMETGAKAARDFLGAIPIVGGGAKMVSALAMGSRLDFPMVWKTSGFQPSYTMTIRLYNPNPKSESSTNKYIIGPIAALMLLGIPLSKDGSTYSWPFIHRIYSPGLFDLDPAFISNITVIKGGDQQQISFGQHLGIVDVRLDFGSLYSTILAGKGLSNNRPTLKKYLQSMREGKEGIQNFSTPGITKSDRNQEELDEFDKAISFAEQGSKNQARTYVEPTQDEIDNPVRRVLEDKRIKSNFLRNNSPEGFVTRYWS